MPSDKFFVNVDRYGNTSAASIPIALCEAISAGRVKAGDKLVLVGFGAGLTWAAVALEWGLPVPVSHKPGRAAPWQVCDFTWAAVRSPGLRLARHTYNRLSGPEGREDWRGQVRKRVDGWRQERKKRDQ